VPASADRAVPGRYHVAVADRYFPSRSVGRRRGRTRADGLPVVPGDDAGRADSPVHDVSGVGTPARRQVAAGRAADVSFVLSELTGAHPAWPGAGLIDPSRIAMAGHSAGGAAALAAMLADPRILAGIDMDGSTVAPIPDHGLSRPFMFLGKQSNYTPGSGSAATTPQDWKLLRAAVITWERDWELLSGWKRWLVVAGAAHAPAQVTRITTQNSNYCCGLLWAS